ncbi:hypothetical protein EB796_016899 [Bugula neritina]|uniref:Uncharacterized protein n=1 Tax=Bugula neritina TaxID=10212 RepID=A0A7J7JF87_BUGNE|nr:hypothetical protein EB796_016899 [Bugula neritina]
MADHGSLFNRSFSSVLNTFSFTSEDQILSNSNGHLNYINTEYVPPRHRGFSCLQYLRRKLRGLRAEALPGYRSRQSK